MDEDWGASLMALNRPTGSLHSPLHRVNLHNCYIVGCIPVVVSPKSQRFTQALSCSIHVWYPQVIFPFRTQWGLQIFKMFHNMFQKMFHNMFHKMFHKMFHNVEVPGQVASQCCEDFSIECGSNGSNKLSWVRFKQVAASSWLPSTSGWAVPINPS